MLALFAKPLIGLAILAALTFGYITFTKHQQSIGYNRAKSEDAAESARLNEIYRIKEVALQSAVTKAQNDAIIAQQTLKTLTAASNSALASLRNQLTNTQHLLSTATRSSLIDYSTTQSTILSDCAREYQQLAEKADGHALDSRTLIQAWPKE
jgi:hypothetical protein